MTKLAEDHWRDLYHLTRDKSIAASHLRLFLQPFTVIYTSYVCGFTFLHPVFVGFLFSSKFVAFLVPPDMKIEGVAGILVFSLHQFVCEIPKR